MNKGVDHAAEIFLFFFLFPTNIMRLINIPLSKQNSLPPKLAVGQFLQRNLGILKSSQKFLFDAIITPLSLSLLSRLKFFVCPPPLVENGGRISDKSVLRMYLPTSPMSKLSSGVRSSSQRGLKLACVPACT